MTEMQKMQLEMEQIKKTNAEINLKCNALLGRYQELVNASIQNFNMYQERINIIEKGVKALHGNLVNLEKRVSAQTLGTTIQEPQKTDDGKPVPIGNADGFVTQAEFKRVSADLYQLVDNIQNNSENSKISLTSIKDNIKREVTSTFIAELEKNRQHGVLIQKEVGQIKTQMYNLQTVDFEKLRGDLFSLQVTQKNDADFIQEFSNETKKQLETLKKKVKSVMQADPQQMKADLQKSIDESVSDKYNTQIQELHTTVNNNQTKIIRHFAETVRRLITVDRSIFGELQRMSSKDKDDRHILRVMLHEGAELGSIAQEALSKQQRVKIIIPANTTVTWNNVVTINQNNALTVEGESYSTSTIIMDQKRTSEGGRAPTRVIVDGFASLNINNVKIEALFHDNAKLCSNDMCGIISVRKAEPQGTGIVVVSNCDIDTDEDLVYVGSSAFGWVGIQMLSLTNSSWSEGHKVHPVEVSQSSGSGFALVSQKAVSLCGEGVEWSTKQPLLDATL